MKPGVLPPSSNIIDKSQSSADQAMHTSDPNGNDLVNNSKLAQKDAWENWSLDAQKHVMKLPSDNPFRQLLMSTAKYTPGPENPNASIPIPTPRPDPNETLPKVLRYPNNKG